MRRTLATVAAFGAALAFLSPSAPAQAAADRPVTAAELRRLYAGKTWMWPDGAGHFAENRQFRAWTGEGPSASVARGRWLVTDGGRLCFEAQWRWRGGADTLRNCFRHRRTGDDGIEQQREPDGEWIPFLSEPPKPTDEAQKLRDGDLVTERLGALEREIGPPRRPPQNRRP